MIVPDIVNPFFPMVVRGAEDAAREHGYNLLTAIVTTFLRKRKRRSSYFSSSEWNGILLTKAAEDFGRPCAR